MGLIDNFNDLKYEFKNKNKKKELFEEFRAIYTKIIREYEYLSNLYNSLDNEYNLEQYLSEDDLNYISSVFNICEIHLNNKMYKSLSVDTPGYQLKEVNNSIKTYEAFNKEIAEGRKRELAEKIENLNLLQEVYEKDLSNLDLAISDLKKDSYSLSKVSSLVLYAKTKIRHEN